MAGVLDALSIEKVNLVTHDIGNMVGYALAAQYPSRVTRFVLIDAPLPGVGPWEEISRIRCSGTSDLAGPTWKGWSKGRERIYLDRFWNEFSRHRRVSAKPRAKHYAKLYGCLAQCIRASCSSPHSTGCDRQQGVHG
jgi:pimeloyl-ACP methyl ester carboxylesterase